MSALAIPRKNKLIIKQKEKNARHSNSLKITDLCTCLNIMY